MTIIPANAGTYLVSAVYIKPSYKIGGYFAFYKSAIVGWRVKGSRRLEPLRTNVARDREEPFETAILLPDGNVETIFGLKTLKDWQDDLIGLHLPILNAEELGRTEEEKELLLSFASEDFY
jgi:hypothetical protein